MGFLLPLFVGPIVSLLVAGLLTNSLYSRGFVVWGFIAGLLTMLAMLGAGHLIYLWNFKQVFSESGPCGLCYEWSGFPLFFWWIGWGVGTVIYLIASVRRLRSIPRDKSFKLIRWPQSLGRWVIGCLTGVVIIVIGMEIPNSIAHEDLVRRIHKVQPSPIQGRVQEIGALPLASPRWTVAVSRDYVRGRGIRFSPDGQWFALAYESKLELWRMADLQTIHTWNADFVSWDSKFAFSPNSTLLAIWTSGDTTVYAIKAGALEPIWQSHDDTYRVNLTFSADSRELIVERNRDVIRRESLTGTMVSTTTISVDYPPNSRPQFALSQYGEYLATDRGQSILVYASDSGQLINQFDTSDKPDLSQSLFGEFSFLPNNSLVFWSYNPSVGIPNLANPDRVWDLTTGASTPVTVSIGLNYFPQVAISPDSRFAIFTSQRESVIWDFETQSMLGSIPVKSAITAAAFTPDQELLVVATADGYLRFFAGVAQND